MRKEVTLKRYGGRIITPIILLLLFITPHHLFAQETPDHPTLFLEEHLEQLANDEEEQNWENELEELSQRLQEPLNLNTATRKQLDQFPFLDDIQIENLLAYLYLHGQMQTLYELQLVEEMDKRTIDLLLPFVCVKPVSENKKLPTMKQILKYGKHEALARLDVPFYTRKGYEKSYLGPALYHSLRYNFHYGDYLQAGITAEKDTGEPMFALHEQRGYDYYSPYLLLQNMGRLKAIALGNYRLNFGMGLVMSTDFRLGKTYSLSTANYRSNGIRKHSGTDEYNYFRGAAATMEVIKGMELSAFYSHRTMDGTVRADTLTSIYKTGLHRSQSEADKRNAFTLQLAGGNLSYLNKTLKVGVTGIYYFLNLPYEPSLNKYARYNLHGREFYNIGMDYRLHLPFRLTLTGEAAKGKQGYALLNRLDWRIASDYRLMLVHRYYSHDYWAMFARSFGESSTPQNENGWYLAAEASPFARWRFFASVDLFSFPWWKYRISKPSQGVDGMFQAVYSPQQDLTMYLQYRYKQKERDVTSTNGNQIFPTHQHKLRYRLSYTPGNWLLRTTADYTCFYQDGQLNAKGNPYSHGYQVTQQAAYSFPFSLSATVQATWFHTDDYDSRIYASERGLLYTFYTPSYSGCGFRYSACLRYDLNRHLMLLAKLGHTIYQDRNEIGSGNDLIPSNRKMDLQIQMRIKF